MRAALGQFSRSVAFVMLTSTIVVVASEKMFWYTGAYSPVGVIELTLFYSLAVMPLLYVVGRYRVDGGGRLVVAAGIFAMVVEGVITPVVYEDGPLPVMFLYFLGWHGLLSVVFLWYTVRRWALRGRRRSLALWSATLGMAWGVWSTNYWRADTIAEQLAENRQEPGLWDVGQWAVPKFGLFAFGFTALVIVCQWLLGFVWPRAWRPSRGWTVVVTVALVAWLGLWTVAIPYAPLKFASFVGFLAWLLRRSRPPLESPTLLSGNVGRARLTNLAPLLLLPTGAVVTYALLTELDYGEPALDAIHWALVVATFLAGALAATWAIATTWLKQRGATDRRTSDATSRACDARSHSRCRHAWCNGCPTRRCHPTATASGR